MTAAAERVAMTGTPKQADGKPISQVIRDCLL